MHDIDKPDDNPPDIPGPGPWTGPPACVIDVSEPFDFDGKRIRAIAARHSDGFVCLNLDDAEKAAADGCTYNGTNPDLSF